MVGMKKGGDQGSESRRDEVSLLEEELIKLTVKKVRGLFQLKNQPFCVWCGLENRIILIVFVPR